MLGGTGYLHCEVCKSKVVNFKESYPIVSSLFYFKLM